MRRISVTPLMGAIVAAAAAAGILLAACGGSSTGATTPTKAPAAATSPAGGTTAPTSPTTTTPTSPSTGAVPHSNTKNVACRAILAGNRGGTFPGPMAEVDPQVLGPTTSCTVYINVKGQRPALSFEAGVTSGQEALNHSNAFQSEATANGGAAPKLLTGSAQSALGFRLGSLDSSADFVAYLMWYDSSNVAHLAYVFVPWTVPVNRTAAAVATLNALVTTQGGPTTQPTSGSSSGANWQQG
jgi:hypothetical protein